MQNTYPIVSQSFFKVMIFCCFLWINVIPNLYLHRHTFYITNWHFKIYLMILWYEANVSSINMYAYHKLYAFILLYFEDVSLGIMVVIAVSLVSILFLELVVNNGAPVVRNNVIFRMDVQVSRFVWCHCKRKCIVLIK